MIICIKILKILCISLMLSGCAGQGWIKKYDVVDGKPILTGLIKFKGRNIKVKDGDTEFETKSWTLPSFPVLF